MVLFFFHLFSICVHAYTNFTISCNYFFSLNMFPLLALINLDVEIIHCWNAPKLFYFYSQNLKKKNTAEWQIKEKFRCILLRRNSASINICNNLFKSLWLNTLPKFTTFRASRLLLRVTIKRSSSNASEYDYVARNNSLTETRALSGLSWPWFRLHACCRRSDKCQARSTNPTIRIEM